MMAARYRVYGNAGSGGPVDYATVLQDSPSTTFSMATIAPGDWKFGVRAYDTVSNLEEMNTDAIVSVTIGSDYLDHTAVPNSPIGLSATPIAGGSVKVDFAYIAAGQGGLPTSFESWLWSGPPNWTESPTATLAVIFGRTETYRHFSMTLRIADSITSRSSIHFV